jgi:hypothetical protein
MLFSTVIVADISRINSMGRESVVVSLREDHEDKENTKDQNPTPGRVRSPAFTSRGTKNFMSPTISAASKIAASPKKKILVDMNEPARTSVSLSSEKNSFRSVRFSDVVEHIDAKADDTGLPEKKIETSDYKEGTFTASNSFRSVRFSDVVEHIDAKADDTGLHEKKFETSDYKEGTFTASLTSEAVTDEPATVTDEPDCVNLDPTFKISPTSSCSWSCPTTLAPLDADPSMPPYDPKTNFLSPRPQFLHYRPNPRVESYLNDESDGRRLEESFSDTEVTEETQSEDSQKESEDGSSDEIVDEDQEEVRVSEDSQKENEDVSSGEILTGVSEPTPISTQLPKEKPQFFTRSKFIVLLLVLSLAGLSISVITKSPVIAPVVLKESIFFEIYDSSGITESAKANLDGLARNFWLWYADSISFVSELMSNFRGVHISDPLHYCNLTDLSEDISLNGYLTFDHSYKGNVLGSFKEREVHIEPVEEEEGQPELEVDEDIGDALEELDDPESEYEGQVSQGKIEEVSEEHGTSESEEVLQALEALEELDDPESEYEGQVSQEKIEEVSEKHGTSESEEVLQALKAEVIIQADNSEARVTSESEEVLQALGAEVIQADNSEAKTTQKEVVLAGNVNFQEQPVMPPKGEEIQSEVSEAVELQVENEMISFDKMESAKVDENPESSELDTSAENLQSSEVGEFPINGTTDDKHFREAVLGIALLVLALLAATVFMYMRKDKRTSSSDSAINVEQPLLTKKLDSSPMSVSTEHNVLERRPSWPTEVEMVGESCPSEMSSFDRSSSYSKKGLKESSEAQSQEKRRKPRNNYKGESLASSSSDFSMGSPSYGSFTTYEKVPTKLVSI